MSLASYKYKSNKVYYIGWSYISPLDNKRHSYLHTSYRTTAKEALQETKDTILMSNYESFRMKVIGNREA